MNTAALDTDYPKLKAMWEVQENLGLLPDQKTNFETLLIAVLSGKIDEDTWKFALERTRTILESEYRQIHR
jgi:hypothetical protein